MPLDPEFHPKSDRIFMLRRYLVAVLFIIAYILLDRSTVYFQIWSEINAWYPPTGLALAFLLGMGLRYAPHYFLAGFIASKVNYHVSIFSFSFLPVNTVVMGSYTAAAYLLRRVFKIDWRLRSIRDVMALLLVSLPASAIVAALGTLALVYDHRIPAAGYFDAALNWWIGDVVSIACVTPFMLVFVLPALWRFEGWSQNDADLEQSWAAVGGREAHGLNRFLESAAFTLVLSALLWIVFGPASADNHDQFYIFFLPIIWIAVRRGLRGATAGILILDLGIVASLSHFHGDSSITPDPMAPLIPG